MSAYMWRCAVQGCGEAKASVAKSVQPTPAWGWGRDGGMRCPQHHASELHALRVESAARAEARYAEMRRATG